MVETIHTAVEGRARYRVIGLHRSEQFRRRLETSLTRTVGIRRASANVLTGNVLVFFDKGRDPAEIARIIEDLASNDCAAPNLRHPGSDDERSDPTASG